MGKFDHILLTVDFDRTLTAPDSTIPRRNIEAIRYFMAEGGAFTVNTGRSVPMYASVLDKIPVNAPLLLYNGSAAYDPVTQKLCFSTPIDLDWHQVIPRIRALLPDLTVEFQGLDAHYIFEPDETWRDFCIANGCAWGFASCQDELGPFLKFTVYSKLRDTTVAHLYSGTPEELRRIDRAAAVIERELGDKIQVFRAAPRILDIHAAGVDKGRGARRLQAQLGRKLLVCVGDAPNDLAMLRAADYAYCPADGLLADRFETVCACADGSVADVIYKKIPEIIG